MHYLFCFSQGVLLSVPEVTPDLQSMKRLWVHECLRVFSDRLIEDADRQWFVGCLRTATANNLQDDFDKMLGRLLDKSGDVSVFWIFFLGCS